MAQKNDTILQGVEWYLPEDGSFWRRLKDLASSFSLLGFTSIWLPPAYKGQAGIHDVGYGVYDLYDLGEFDQKGTICTKYGTKLEYIDAVKTLKAQNLHFLEEMGSILILFGIIHVLMGPIGMKTITSPQFIAFVDIIGIHR